MGQSRTKNDDVSVHGVSRYSTLSSSVHQRLNSYVLAAGAAGVAVLACSVPAEGTPICRQISFILEGTNTYSLNPAKSFVAPFNIAETFSSVSSHATLALNRAFFTPNSPDADVLLTKYGLPADLPFGARVGPGGNFGKGLSYGLLFSTSRDRHRGNLLFGETNYFGYKFRIAGESHYGWVQMTATLGSFNVAESEVIATGYESTPNAPIRAGSCANEQPISTNVSLPSAPSDAGSDHAPGPSLGALALGVQGLALWRR